MKEFRGSFLDEDNPEKLTDFYWLTREDFLLNYPEITEAEYNATVKQLSFYCLTRKDFLFNYPEITEAEYDATIEYLNHKGENEVGHFFGKRSDDNDFGRNTQNA